MQVVIILTLIAIISSYLADKEKTKLGIKTGVIMFVNILPTILVVIVILSIVLHYLPNELIVRYFGKGSGFFSYVLAAIIGSIALIPGFIAYPLAGILLKNGVSYPVVAVFISTLLMVNVITLPLEAKYFGTKTAVLRNSLGFIAAIIIGFIIGLIM
jgi:uncharacterized membrane protein YraQ (UPF0718 family)